MKSKRKTTVKDFLRDFSSYFFLVVGITFILAAIAMIGISVWHLIECFFYKCESTLMGLIDFIEFLIISVAIFDVGRYFLEECVLRPRELRTPSEARQSLTKFMVVIVIAVTLEALLNVIKTGTTDVSLLMFPAALFFFATLLLVGLSLYQRYSVMAEILVKEKRNIDSD